MNVTPLVLLVTYTSGHEAVSASVTPSCPQPTAVLVYLAAAAKTIANVQGEKRHGALSYG
jgi:hypothetical protein